MTETQAARDRRWLQRAVDLAAHCPPSATAFAVGAVIVDAAGVELATGYSRETDEHVHAEESALVKLDPADDRLPGATVYSSLEPCSVRKSRPRSCTQLILAAGVGRVVFALREPLVFVDCDGAEQLAAAGVEVVRLDEFADQVRAANPHVFGQPVDGQLVDGPAASLAAAVESGDPELLGPLLHENVRWGGEEDTADTCHSRGDVLRWYGTARANGLRVWVDETETRSGAVVCKVRIVAGGQEALRYQVFRVVDGLVVEIRGYPELADALAWADRG
ncbi:hypothetical protein F0L68_32170 [Solihabitans fulvus]|uniref:CMP/dCMP-type deaminase domain-containing protein n=1 Tax=Solihabitans fulvus TaxID=1892852 RepID=A0A5B2WPP0_9PSEU|nr:hypothetical protein [Solihabitans fulvus]KAA2253923.1 hypothetical protein F0L68_32170 [Solihabitans fulvus]